MTRERLLLFAPGAGAASSSPWMQSMKARLEAHGAVECFDYPYQLAGRKTPDRHAVLVAAHREGLERARSAHAGKTVLVGKSMGSRIGCHVAVASENPPAALVCLGFPLVGQNGRSREAVLLELRTPVLFVQGTRDRLCPLDLLKPLLAKLHAPHALHEVEDGDHSLAVLKSRLKSRGEDQAAVYARAVAAIAVFLDRFA